MTVFLDILENFLLVLLGIYFLRIVGSFIVTWYYFFRHKTFSPSIRYTPDVSVIKPVKGIDDLAQENFRSFCEQDYSGKYEIVFCVESESDPSLPLIKKIIEEYPEKDIRLVFSDSENNQSFGKIKNMITGFYESKYGVIIFSDSDVYAPKTFIENTVKCLVNPKTGLGFQIPAYQGAKDWIAAMFNLTVNETFINLTPLYLFGLCKNGAIGTTMVVRRRMIEEIGGLFQFGNLVTDDIPLARAIYDKGYNIYLLKQPAPIFHLHDNFRNWWLHLKRWLVIIRHYMPWTIISSFLADTPFFVSILYLAILLLRDKNIYPGVLLTCMVLAVRFLSTALINLKFVGDKNLWRFIWVIPIIDLLRVPLLLHVCGSNKIVWRGRKMRVNRDCSVSFL